MKKKILKYIGIFILVLVLLVAGLLALLPSIVKQQATKYYAQAVPEGVLSIEDVGINFFTGKLLLKGVNATSKKDNVLELGRFNVELSVKDLLSKNIHLQTLTLSDFNVLIERKGNQVTVAGYTLPATQKDKDAHDEKKEPLSLQSMGIEQLDIQNVELKNIRAKLKGEYINANGVVKSLVLKNIHSDNKQPAILKADIKLNALSLKQTKQNPLMVDLIQPATLALDATIKNLFDKPDAKINSKLKFKALVLDNDKTKLNISQPATLIVDANIKDVLNKPKADINAQLNLNALALDTPQMKAGVEHPVKLNIQTKISDALNNPSANFDIDINASSIYYQHAERDAQRVKVGVDMLKLQGVLSDVSKQASLTTDIDIKKLNWDVQIDNHQTVVGYSESITLPNLAVKMGEKRLQEWLKGVPLNVLSFSNLKITQLKNKAMLPGLIADMTLKELSVEGFDVLDSDSSTRLKADIALNAFDYNLNKKDKVISLAPNANFTVQAHVEGLNQPTIEADAQLNQLVLNAKEFNYPILKLNEINLKKLNLKKLNNPTVNIQNIDLNQAVFMGEKKPLLKLTTHLQGLALKNNQLVIDDVVLKDMSSNVTFAPKYKIAKIEKLLNYFSSNKAKPSSTPKSDFKAVVKHIHTKGNNVVRIKDASLQPAVNHELLLKKIDIKNINTNNKQASTTFDLDVNLGKYSNVALKGDYMLLAKAPSGKVKGKLDNIDLINYNTYLAKFIGYKAKTGALSVDVDVGVKQAELSGGVDVLLNNLDLSPSNKDTIASLKKQLSMPLDQSLNLLKDKQGKIKVDLPMSGNINAPDFSLSGVMTLVTKKALKTATVIGLKQMIQPYGSLLTIGEWAGDKLLAVKLDPIEYDYGDTQISKDKMPYLDKVIEILKAKEALSLKLCAKISKQEAEFAMLKPEELLPIANKRSEHVRAYLIEKGSLSTGRILQCESEVSEKNEPYSWLDLEI